MSGYFCNVLLMASILMLGTTAQAHEGHGNTVIHALAHLLEQQSIVSIGILIAAVIAIAIIKIRNIKFLTKQRDR